MARARPSLRGLLLAKEARRSRRAQIHGRVLSEHRVLAEHEHHPHRESRIVLRRSKEFGITHDGFAIDIADVRERKRRIVHALNVDGAPFKGERESSELDLIPRHVAEHIQRPVVDCRASKMRVVETSSEVSLEFDWFDSGCTLFGPAQSPGSVQASIPCALWSRLGKPLGVEQ